MARRFDPYAEWLHVSGSAGVPNHYQLLGLPPFEGRNDVVRDALSRRLALVGPHLAGPNASIARRLTTELQQAAACLSNVRAKGIYDSALRQQGINAAASPQGADAGLLDLLSQEEAAAGPAATSSPAPVAWRQPAAPVPAQWPRIALFAGGGVVVGMSLVIAAILLARQPGSNPDTIAAAATQTTAAPPPLPQPNTGPPAPQAAPLPSPADAPDNAGLPAPDGSWEAELPADIAAVYAPLTHPQPPSDAQASLPADAQRSAVLAGRRQRLESELASVDYAAVQKASQRLQQFMRQWTHGSTAFRRGNFQALLGLKLLIELDRLLESDSLEAPQIKALLAEPLKIEIADRTYPSEPRLAVESCLVLYGGAVFSNGYTLHWLWEESMLRLREPAPRPPEPSESVPSIFASLPASVELPPIGFADLQPEVPLGRIELAAGEDLQLALLCEQQMAAAVRRFDIVRDRDDRRWLFVAAAPEVAESNALATNVDQATSVAELTLRDAQLAFRWLGGAAAASGNDLRNCVLRLQTPSHQHLLHLRTPRGMLPVTVDLDTTMTVFPLPAKASLPTSGSLTLELTQWQGLPDSTKVLPETRRITGSNQDLRIILREQVPSVEIRLQLFAAGARTSLRIVPVVVDTDGKTTIPFTTERINGMHTTLPKSIADNKNELLLLARDRIPALRRDIDTVSRVVPKSLAEQNAQAQQVAGLRQRLNRAVERQRWLTNNIPALERRLSVLPGLADLGNVVNRAAELQVRVFYHCADDVESNVLLAAPSAVPTEQYERLRGKRVWNFEGGSMMAEIAFLATVKGQQPGPSCNYVNFSALKSIVVTLRTPQGEIRKVNSELFDAEGRKALQQIWDYRTELARNERFAYVADAIAVDVGNLAVRAVSAVKLALSGGGSAAWAEASRYFGQIAELLLMAEIHLPPEHAATIRDTLTYDIYRLSPDSQVATRVREGLEEVKARMHQAQMQSTAFQDSLRKRLARYNP